MINIKYCEKCKQAFDIGTNYNHCPKCRILNEEFKYEVDEDGEVSN